MGSLIESGGQIGEQIFCLLKLQNRLPLAGFRPAISPAAKPGCLVVGPHRGPAFYRLRGKTPEILGGFQDFGAKTGGKAAAEMRRTI